MQHSAFDLEVYAKHHQGQLQREIARMQQFDAARARGQVSRSMPGSRLSRLLETARIWLTGKSGQASPAPHVPAPGAAIAPEQAAYRLLAKQQKPVPAGDAYAGLVVIARASAVPVSKQPSNVGER